jgi:hypothetical protein
MEPIVRAARRSDSRCGTILTYAARDSVSLRIDAWYKAHMVRRARRIAAWGALLAMALHALSPLAAPAPRAGAPGLHDICTSAPAAPQPAGDPSSSHCALCVASASIASPSVVPGVFAAEFQTHFFNERPFHTRPPYPAAPPRGPPAGA